MEKVGARGYGIELKERIVDALKAGQSVMAVAERFAVHHNTVRRYQRQDREGTLSQRKRPTGRPPRMQAAHEQQLLQQVKEHPAATLLEHASLLQKTTGLAVSQWTVDRIFRKHGVTHGGKAGRTAKT